MAALSCIGPSRMQGQLSSFSVSGYVKYLFSSAKLSSVQKRLNDQLVHARINTKWYPSDSIQAALELRMRGFYGDSVQRVPHFLDQVRSPHEYGSLDSILWHTEKSLGYIEVDRLWMNYSKGKLDATIGRQRIAWGTALVWNVTDLFNPQSILDFDYEEKPGADALRIQCYTGAVSKVEISIKPGKSRKSFTAAGLFSINAFAYDFYAIAGMRNNRWVLGGAWAGSILKAGFRGEFLISDAPAKGFPGGRCEQSDPGCAIWAGKKPVASVVLSGDYTFPGSLYIHTEVLYNSNGRRRNAGMFWETALQVGMLSPSRWSLFQEISCNITPLWRGSLFGIFNPNDRSWIMVPQLAWSAATNLDFTAIAYFTFGDRLTEWSGFGNSLWLRLKYSF